MNKLIILIILIIVVVSAVIIFKPAKEEIVIDQEALDKEIAACEIDGGEVIPCEGEDCDFGCAIKLIPVFEDFPVAEKFEDVPVAIDFSSHPAATTFMTRINEGAQGSPNFAGHYTIIEWGCGTSCQTGVIFDAKTGLIYDLPGSELGKEFKIDSALLIVNSKLEDITLEGMTTKYYQWQNNQFELIE